jgi:hypothetical protein
MKISILVFAALGGAAGYYAPAAVPFLVLACLGAVFFCALHKKFRRPGLPAALALSAGLVLGFVNASRDAARAETPRSPGLP